MEDLPSTHEWLEEVEDWRQWPGRREGEPYSDWDLMAHLALDVAVV